MPGIGQQQFASEADYRASLAAFREADANCNTCRHLIRVKHPRDPLGFLQGRCAQGNHDSSPQQFQRGDGVFAFHPHDPMLMPCWAAR